MNRKTDDIKETEYIKKIKRNELEEHLKKVIGSYYTLEEIQDFVKCTNKQHLFVKTNEMLIPNVIRIKRSNGLKVEAYMAYYPKDFITNTQGWDIDFIIIT